MQSPRPHLLLLLLSAVLAACAAPQALPVTTGAVLNAPADRDIGLTVGQTRQLPLSVGGSPASPADVVWTSSNTDVVSVDLGGNVTAVGPGSASVRVSLRATPGLGLSYALNVTPAPGVGGSYERRVLELVNQARAQGRNCGDKSFAAAPPVVWSTALASASEAYSRDMATRGYFGHTSPEGRDLDDRLRTAGVDGFKQQAENIAGGQPTPEAAMLNWLLSPTHCANIMNPAFHDLGVGYVKGGAYQHYWTEIFAAK